MTKNDEKIDRKLRLAPVERPVRPGIVLRVVAGCGMVDVDSDTDEFSFGLIEGMYKSGVGFGCQVGDESKREAVEKMCFRIAEALRDYRAETA
jgi:hypothetical protein